MIRSVIRELRTIAAILSRTTDRHANVLVAVSIFCCIAFFSNAASAAISWKRVGTVTTLTNNQMCYTDGTNVICDSNAPTISGNNVGIGTTTPQNLLDVYGAVAIGTSYAGISIAPTNGAIIQGNVGIGTTAPGYTLSIKGVPIATATGDLQLSTPGTAQGERSSTSLYSTFQGTGDNAPRRTADIIAGFNGGAWGNEYLAFNVGNNGGSNDTQTVTSEKIRITSAGNVGIGTSSPTEIFVSARSDSNTYASSSVSQSAPYVGGAGATFQDYNYSSTDSSGAYHSFKVTNAAGNSQRAVIAGISTTGAGVYTPAMVFVLQTGLNAYNEYMRIGSNGYVGIGTTNPATLLHVNGVETVGINGGTGGQITLNGATSGSVALKVATAAGVGTVFQMPATNGSNGYILQTDGTGVTSWIAAPAPSFTGLTSTDFCTASGTTAIICNTASTGTGNVVLSASPTLTGTITAAAANFSGVITDTQSIGATSTNGLVLTDTTAATVGAQKWSPRIHFTGQGWKTAATAGSQAVDMIEELQPVQGVNNPSGNLTWSSSVNGAAYGALMTLTTDGNVGIGTAGPDYNLTVAGQIGLEDVNPIIRTETTSGATNTKWFQMNTYASGASSYFSIDAVNDAVNAATNAMVIQRTGTTVNSVTFPNGNVGIGSTAPVTSLDLSQKTDALTLPVGTTGTRPAGAVGEIRYNLTTPGVEAYVNGAWTALLGGAGGVLGVPNGGTGDSTLTANGVLYGNGTSAVGITAQGAANTILTANAGAPVFSAAPTIGTSVTSPLLIGGTGVASTLTLESTSGVGTSDAIIFKTGSQAEAMRITTGGIVGIGTATPAAASTMEVYTSSSAASGSSYGVVVQGPQTVADTGTYYGIYNNPNYNAASGNTLAALLADDVLPQNTSSGTVTSMYGVNASPQNTSAGIVSTMYGVRAIPVNTTTATGTVTTMYGLYSQCQNAGTGAGTTANCYELYLGTPTTTSPITNEYGVYQQSANATNYFAGGVGIGSTTPAQALDVNGNVNFSNGTSTTIFYGTHGVAAPANASAGEKIQLYGTAGMVSSTDYALGVQGSNMWFNSGGGFYWYNSATAAMVLTSGGNVGIGTTIAANLLTLSTTTANDGLALNGAQTAGNTTAVTIRTNMTAGAYNSITQAGDSGLIYSGTTIGTPKGFVIAPWASGTSGLRMDTSGNVGIGSTNPVALLDITKSALSAAPALTGNYFNVGATTLTDSSTATSGTATNNAINAIAAPTLAATNTAVTTTNAYSMYLGGAPKKGTNNTATNAIALGIGAAAVGAQTNSYGLYVNAQTGATNNYGAVFATGNVGIGTTTPNGALDVSPAANQHIVIQGNQDFGAGATITSYNDAGNTYEPLEFRGNSYYFLTTGGTNVGIGYLPTASATLAVNGNVGIGTTVPSAFGIMTVANTPTVWTNYWNITDAMFRDPEAEAVGTGGGITLAGNNQTVGFTEAAGAGLQARKTNATVGDNTFGVDLWSRGGAINFVQSGTLGTAPSMAIAVGGNVGIGSTAPVASLDMSQNTDALALPVGTTGTRPTGGALTAGEIRYNQTTPGVEAYVNGSWTALLGGAGGVLGVPNGGTGDSTLMANGVLYGNGTSAVGITAQGAANTILTANAGAPVFSAAPTIGTSVTSPLHIGGTAASSTLTLESTSGVGTSDAIIFKTGSQAEAMRITTGGNIAIGTTNPGVSSLDVYTSSSAASGSSWGVLVGGPQTVADTGTYFGIESNPTYTAVIGNTLANLTGLYSGPANTSTGTITNLRGVQAGPANSGGGVITSLFGEESQPSNSSGTVTAMYGLYANPTTSGTAVTTTTYGVYTVPQLTGSGALSAMYGIFDDTFPSAAASGSVTNEYGIYIRGGNNSTAAAVVTNYYQMFLATPLVAGTITNTVYGIYQQYASATNYFAGNVGIGTATVASNVGLDVYLTGAGYIPISAEATGNGTVAIAGEADGATSYGVEGITTSTTTSYAVFGQDAAATGANYGVYGQSASSGGAGGYFTNTSSGYALLTGTGNVGIGTTSPGTALQVNSSTTGGIFVNDSDASGNATAPLVRVRGVRLDANSSQSFTGGLVLEHVNTAAAVALGAKLGTIYFGGNYDTTPDMAYAASISGVADGAFTGTSVAPTALAFYTGSTSNALGTSNITYGTEVMRISSAGNVGIGSTAPVSSLDLSKETDALALPVGTTGTRPTGGALTAGEIRYNQTTPGVEAYVNGSWTALLGGAGGVLGVPNGGTGDSTLTANGVLYGNGASAVGITAQGAANTILTANAGSPVFSATPTIGTSVTSPLHIGGAAAGSTLTLESTSGAGTSDAIIFKTGSQAEAMRITTAGIVSIGTATPNAMSSLDVYTTSSAASGATYGVLVTGPQTVADTGTYYGIYASPSYTAVTGNTLAALNGLYDNPINSSTGTVTTLRGTYDIPQNIGGGTVTTMYGLLTLPQTTGTSTTTTTYGIYNNPQLTGSGALTTVYGEYVDPYATATSSGTIANQYGIYVRGGNASTAGTVITNYYQMFLATPLVAGTITNTVYGIYQAGASALNYFAGNVGIGTTVPDEALYVKTAAASGVVELANTNTSGWSDIDFFDSSGTDQGSVGYGNSGVGAPLASLFFVNSKGAQAFITNNAEKMRITAAGNVGIGTATPVANLHINSGNNTSNSYSIFVGNSANTDYVTNSLNVTNATSLAGNTGGVVEDFIFTPSATASSTAAAGLFHTEIPAAASFGTTGTVYSLLGQAETYASSAVNTLVGLQGVARTYGTGTITNMAGLEAQGGIYNNANQTVAVTNSYGVYSSAVNNSTAGTISSDYGLYVTMPNSGTVTHGYGVYITGVGTSGGTWTNTPYDIYAGDSGVYNYFAGSVGIGTTAPSVLLSTGTTLAPVKIATYDGGIGIMYGMGVASGELTFGAGINGSSGTPQMVLTNAGSVGIGTTTPTANLDIEQARTGNDTLLNLGVTGLGVVGDSVNLTFSEPGVGGAVHVSAGISGIMGQSNSLGSLAFSTARVSGVLTEAMRIDDLGNVAIGTTSASYLLDVKGTIRTTQAVLNSSAVPTISTCGTSPPAATAGSNNNSGQFTLGTGATAACTVTFANAFPTAAYCTVTPASSYAGTYYISAQSKSAFTVTLGTGTASVKFNYTCGGN